MARTFVTPLAVAAFLGLASAAFAQQAPAPAAPAQPEPSREHLASARSAMEASKAFAYVDDILLTVAQQTKAVFQRSNPSLSQPIEEVTNKVAIELAARRGELDRENQKVWANKFSKAELDEITRFYNSPVGKKLVAETEPLVVQVRQNAGAWHQKLSADMVQRVREEMKKLGYNL